MKIGYLFKSEFFKLNQGMLKKKKSLFFDGDLRRFEKILLDYFVEVGLEKGNFLLKIRNEESRTVRSQHF